MIKSDTIQVLINSDLAEQGLHASEFFPGMTYRDAAAVSLKSSIVKKWIPESTDKADQAALDKFLEVNKECGEWSLPTDLDSWSEMLLNGFKQAVWDFWNVNGFPLVDNLLSILDKSRVGPGANRGALGGDFYTKLFSSPLTCSDRSLYLWYSHYIARFAEWKNAETIRLLNFGEPRVVNESRLSFVPKNDKISRCICIEPTLNTFVQLGFENILNSRLRNRFGIDFAVQQGVNRDLARLGSITDGLCTIDLQSASDSVSVRMLRWGLPRDFFDLLMKMRCDRVSLPNGGVVDLNMISTMGNGSTFPLQTIIFSCIVTACMKFREIPFQETGSGFTKTTRSSENLWSVYGDDIIVPRSILRDVLRLLGLLGFKVNSEKSFVEGPFRESCGSDFFLGLDIRGVYLRRLVTASDFYSAINRLVLFSTKTGLSLERTIKFLLSKLRKPLFVPPEANPDSGIRVPLSIAKQKRAAAWLAPGLYSYQFLAPRVPKILVIGENIVVPPGAKPRIYNPSGLLISVLQGSIVGGAIGLRKQTEIRYQTKREVTPRWDFYKSWDRSNDYFGLDWGRWNSCIDFYIL